MVCAATLESLALSHLLGATSQFDPLAFRQSAQVLTLMIWALQENFCYTLSVSLMEFLPTSSGESWDPSYQVSGLSILLQS